MSEMTKGKEATFICEPARQIPVIEDADVVVVGGGPGGVPAAIEAARDGASVLLIEHYGFLGGLASAGMIGPLFGYNTAWTDKLMLGGIPVEIVRELQALGGAPENGKLTWFGIPFEPEMMKHALERLAVKAGVRFLFHTKAVGVTRTDGRIESVLVESKSGRGAVRGRMFIDATGDADVAWFAGCDYEKGRPFDGAMQAMGTKFRIGGLRDVTDEERQLGSEAFLKAIADKTIHAYGPFQGEVSEFGATVRLHEETPTVTRARGDGTNVLDLTRNEIKLRADTLKIIDFCRECVPGYENCYLMATPPQIGVRETRRVTGGYVLSKQDCVDGARFADGIARGSWFFDIHCPMGLTSPGSWCCDQECQMPGGCLVRNQHFETLNHTRHLETGSYYDIPYRSLVPKKIDNLLISGRCISADHVAHASLRVIATCFAIGQAAGTAAAMSLASNCDPKDLSGVEVRETLKSAGVPL